MFTHLAHPSNLLLAGLFIVLAELAGAALVTSLILAVRRLRPAFVPAAMRRHR